MPGVLLIRSLWVALLLWSVAACGKEQQGPTVIAPPADTASVPSVPVAGSVPAVAAFIKGHIESRSRVQFQGYHRVHYEIHDGSCPSTAPLKRSLAYTGASGLIPILENGTYGRALPLLGTNLTFTACVAAGVELYNSAGLITMNVGKKLVFRNPAAGPLDTLVLNFEIP